MLRYMWPHTAGPGRHFPEPEGHILQYSMIVMYDTAGPGRHFPEAED